MTAKDFLILYKADEKKVLQNRSQMLSAEHRAWEICSRNYFEYTSEFEDRLWAENEELAGEMAAFGRKLQAGVVGTLHFGEEVGGNCRGNALQ